MAERAITPAIIKAHQGNYLLIAKLVQSAAQQANGDPDTIGVILAAVIYNINIDQKRGYKFLYTNQLGELCTIFIPGKNKKKSVTTTIIKPKKEKQKELLIKLPNTDSFTQIKLDHSTPDWIILLLAEASAVEFDEVYRSRQAWLEEAVKDSGNHCKYDTNNGD